MQVPPLTLQQMEDRAAAFNTRYGIKASWPDKQIDRALKDHGLPSLDSMPDHGVGAMGVMPGRYGPYGGEDDKTARRRWQRTNAMHRLGHIIAEHPAEAIASCASCAEMAREHVPPSEQARVEGGK